MKFRFCLSAFAILLLACCAYAQVPGRKFRWQSAAMSAGNPTMLLAREDVREDMGLTDDQKTKLNDLRAHIMEQFQTLFSNQDEDQETRMKAAGALMKEAGDEADKILTPEQHARLVQIVVQLDGNTAVVNAEIQKEINLSDDQKIKIDDLAQQASAANRKVIDKARSGDITWDEVQDLSDKNAKALDDEIGKILTSEQHKKLAQISGRPFKAAPDSAG